MVPGFNGDIDPIYNACDKLLNRISEADDVLVDQAMRDMT